MSDSNGDYSGDSSSSDSSSSLDENSELLLKPVFLKKSNSRKPTEKAPVSKLAIARAEHHQQIDAKEAVKEDFDGVDDTDNLDPEQEYEMWKLREKERKKRDRQKLEEVENEKEDALRRQKESAVDFDIQSNFKHHEEQEINTSRTRHAQLGSFYSSSIDDRLLKRDYKDIEDLGDHSRPTKYKRN